MALVFAGGTVAGPAAARATVFADAACARWRRGVATMPRRPFIRETIGPAMTSAMTCLDAYWDDLATGTPMAMPLPQHVSADTLAPAEQIAYRLINHAAEHGQPCPVNIDLEVAAGFNSSSMGPKLVRKLESRGLIRVSRFQRFRLVEIVATGKQTARHPSMHADRPLVRRGARSASAMGLPSDRKPYAAC